MVGGFSFQLVSKRVEYQFDIKRKITKVVGNSATGKSEFVRILADSQTINSGVAVSCKYRCRVIRDIFTESVKNHIDAICQRHKNHNSQAFAEAMRNYLSEYDNTLIFADEDFKHMNTDEFALFCKFTDSFFVLFCREPLCKMPYSYTDIYTIKTSGKFHALVPVFKDTDYLKFYEDRKMIVEDSNSGYEFFSHFYNNVVPAGGKSKIDSWLVEPNIEVIADGAAFGCEMEKVTWSILRNKLDTKLFLPESFEYLILSSELFGRDIKPLGVLEPIHTISGRYFSWEQYFTELLTDLTKGLANNYSKFSLNECYYRACCWKNGSLCNIEQTTKKKEAVLGKYLVAENAERPR